MSDMIRCVREEECCPSCEGQRVSKVSMKVESDD